VITLKQFLIKLLNTSSFIINITVVTITRIRVLTYAKAKSPINLLLFMFLGTFRDSTDCNSEAFNRLPRYHDERQLASLACSLMKRTKGHEQARRGTESLGGSGGGRQRYLFPFSSLKHVWVSGDQKNYVPRVWPPPPFMNTGIKISPPSLLHSCVIHETREDATDSSQLIITVSYRIMTGT
jgi:hypothetical protein